MYSQIFGYWSTNISLKKIRPISPIFVYQYMLTLRRSLTSERKIPETINRGKGRPLTTVNNALVIVNHCKERTKSHLPMKFINIHCFGALGVINQCGSPS